MAVLVAFFRSVWSRRAPCFWPEARIKSFFLQSASQVCVRLDIGGIEANGFPEFADGAIQVAGPLESQTQIVMRVCRLRLQPDRFAEFLDRGSEFTIFRQRLSQVVVGLDGIREQTNDLMIFGNGFLQVAVLAQRLGKAESSIGWDAGIEFCLVFQKLTVFPYRVPKFASLLQIKRERELGVVVGRLQLRAYP